MVNPKIKPLKDVPNVFRGKILLRLATPARQILLTDQELVVSLAPSVITRIQKLSAKDFKLRKALESLYRWAIPPRLDTNLVTRARLIPEPNKPRKIVEIRYKYQGYHMAYIYDLAPDDAQTLVTAINRLVTHRRRNKPRDIQ